MAAAERTESFSEIVDNPPLILKEKKTLRPSTMYSVLPVVVQNRIPAIPSLRKSISTLHSRTISLKSFGSGTDLTAPVSPPPSYTSRNVSGSSTPTRASIISTDTEDLDFQDDFSDRPSSSRSLPPAFAPFESETGINWKYATQGISLMNQAHQESNALARDNEDASALITRQFYIHGVSYLLRGVPPDLTQEELLSLQTAIPLSLQEFRNNPGAHAMIPLTNEGITQQQQPQNPSLLHRVTATLVFQTFVLIQFLLPYIRLFIGHAYRFEKEHKMIQRSANYSIVKADALRRRGIQLSHTICQMNDGKVGQAINDVTIWWIQGLTGGLQQGLSDGVVIFGTEKQGQKGSVEKLE